MLHEHRSSSKSRSRDTSKQQPKLNLFFIKSKHVFKTYKNHDYFENIAKPLSTVYPRKNKTQTSLQFTNQFVSQPPPFGIDNAYHYICNQMHKNNIEKQRHHSFKIKKCKTLSHEQQFMKISNQTQKRVSFADVGMQKKGLIRRNKARFEIGLGVSSDCVLNLRDSIQEKYKLSQLVQFQYISVNSCAYKVNPKVQLNIYPYVLNTFLKAHINYNQITEEFYQQLIPNILLTASLIKQPFSYENIVNLNSIHKLSQVLQPYHPEHLESKETIRYFFVCEENIREYQLEKIKDQVRTIASFQFNIELGNQEIYLYDTCNGKLIQDLYDLLRSQSKKIIFGTNPNALTLFQKARKEKIAQESLANRLKKWKSVAPEDENQTTHLAFKSMPIEKYNKLFLKFKHKNRKCEPRKAGLSLKNSQFIDRQKLIQSTQIFE